MYILSCSLKDFVVCKNIREIPGYFIDFHYPKKYLSKNGQSVFLNLKWTEEINGAIIFEDKEKIKNLYPKLFELPSSNYYSAIKIDIEKISFSKHYHIDPLHFC